MQKYKVTAHIRVPDIFLGEEMDIDWFIDLFTDLIERNGWELYGLNEFEEDDGDPYAERGNYARSTETD